MRPPTDARVRSIWRTWGLTRRCPVCGWRCRRFLAFGPSRRPDAQCPRCGSAERHRLVWVYLRERTDLFRRPHVRLLHIAPEAALQGRLERLPNVEYLSGDLDSPRAMARLDVTRLDLPDGGFDVILANHVLEHVPDDAKAMRELRRVLAPGGWAILQVPMDVSRARTDEDPAAGPAERLRRFGQVDHVRIYGRDYADRLRAAGFVVTVEPFGARMTPSRRRRLRIDPTEDLYVCRTPA